MNNRHRRIARLKELERRRIFKKSQKAIRNFIKAMDGMVQAWESFEVEVAREFGIEVAE